MSEEESDERNRDKSSRQKSRDYQGKEEDISLWGSMVFGLVGAAVTTICADLISDDHRNMGSLSSHLNVTKLRRFDWSYLQLSRSQSSRKDGRSFRTSFQEEAWKRYNRRMQEEYEEELERVERIRRMQNVFNRERNKFKGSYEKWHDDGPGAYHQNSQRNDWYWKADTSFGDRSSNFREIPRANARAPLSHHYSILGLDRLRTKPYSDDEIKSAFRTKAKEFHPDQNQNNKEFAEAKFKEVMVSYEAIKSERKNK